jgi:Uma2 family endonuclease
MSQPAAATLAPLPFELVLDDGEPLESEWHAIELPLLHELILRAMEEQERTDFFAGVNNFVYYSIQQARQVFEEENKRLEKRAFRGPDVFWVDGVDPDRDRQAWIVWEEGGRLPDVIVELLSPSTAEKDRTEKKDLYARVFRTAEYFLYDPLTRHLEGLRLAGRNYEPIQPDPSGRLWSEQLQASFGLWNGRVKRRKDDWLRLFHADGTLVLTEAEAERRRAEMERRRAEAAETEILRLRALLAEQGRG